MTPDELERVPHADGGDRADAAAARVPAPAPDPRGDRLDLRRLVRRSLARAASRSSARAAPQVEPRKLVFLCDVSGSMEPYARALLLFLHAVVGTGPGVEAFAFGTRLTRLTPELARATRSGAGTRAGAVDWGGGTRIGGR